MPPEPPRTRWPRIMLLVAAGYAVSLQAGKLPAALPVLTSALDLDLVSAGWLLSAVTVVAAAVGITVGSAATRVGVERMMLIGLVLNAVGSAIGAVAPGVAGIAVSRVVEGAGFIAAVVVHPAAVACADTACRPSDRDGRVDDVFSRRHGVDAADRAGLLGDRRMAGSVGGECGGRRSFGSAGVD